MAVHQADDGPRALVDVPRAAEISAVSRELGQGLGLPLGERARGGGHVPDLCTDDQVRCELPGYANPGLSWSRLQRVSSGSRGAVFWHVTDELEGCSISGQMCVHLVQSPFGRPVR